MFKTVYFNCYLDFDFLSSVLVSLHERTPDDVDPESPSVFLWKLASDDDDVSVFESHGFVLIRHLCRGDGAARSI